MTPAQSNPDTGPRPQPFRWSRADATQACHDFHHPEHPPPSQRQFARDHGLPRSTLGSWIHRPQDVGLEPELVAFLDSPVGYRFLRRLVAALHLVFHLAGDAGLRPLSRFLELTQLDRFVAPSFGAQQALAVRLQDTLIAYADEQKQRLSARMPPRKITACLDENFHGSQPCLVAVEPESRFLLMEAYYPQRDGDTWTMALKQALTGMPVEVIQVTSDQAKGLIACARDGLEAQHTPDLFHGQRELSKATSLPLHRQVETAQKEVARAQAHTQERLRPGRAGAGEARGTIMTPTDFLAVLESVLRQRRVAFTRAAAIAFVESCWELIADDPDVWYWSERFVEAGAVEVPC